MAWAKGQSGNGGGSQKRRLITGHIERELLEECEDLRKKLEGAVDAGNATKARAIAKKVVDLAVEGNAWAIQFVTERTEGKPDQPVSIRRNVQELTDADLADIALGSRDGAAETTTGAQKPASVH